MELSKITYREATTTDILRLLELEQSIIGSERPYDRSIKDKGTTYYDMGSLIADADSYLIVVEEGGLIVGCGYAQIRPSKNYHTHELHCYLGFIYVEPKSRGCGIAKSIVKELTEWGVSRGIRNFYLDVYACNESAIRAYEKFGFSKLAVEMELVL
ncbi:MAG: RimJ/RimL family protein N-acetyltransferase [Granulosicoccus sp.]